MWVRWQLSTVTTMHKAQGARVLSFPSSMVLPSVNELSQCLEDLPAVVMEVPVDLVDGLILNHPQLALCLQDQPGVVAHHDHPWQPSTPL